MPGATDEFETLLSLASAWVEEQEQLALREGVPLDDAQVKDACAAGVSQPHRVRLLKVGKVPLPEHPILAALCAATKALGPSTWALSARYGILVRSERWSQRDIIVHELIHTSQYEKLGGIEPFLRQYLHECLTTGYPQAPMEQEAVRGAAKICGSSAPR